MRQHRFYYTVSDGVVGVSFPAGTSLQTIRKAGKPYAKRMQARYGRQTYIVRHWYGRKQTVQRLEAI